jgi:hypothetical protein
MGTSSGYFPAGCGSQPRPRRPEPAFAYPLACPQCVSRRIKPDHARVTIALGVCARGLIAGRLTIPTCLPAPRAAAGIHSNSALRQQRSARRCKSQPLRYVRCLPKLDTAGAHVPPSAHGVGIRLASRLAASQRNEGARELVGERPLVKQHLRDGARALFACPMPRTESNDRFASPPTTGPHGQMRTTDFGGVELVPAVDPSRVRRSKARHLTLPQQEAPMADGLPTLPWCAPHCRAGRPSSAPPVASTRDNERQSSSAANYRALVCSPVEMRSAIARSRGGVSGLP